MTTMRHPVDDGPTVSPRIPDRVVADHPHSTRTPAPHTADEIPALLDLMLATGVSTITIGHGRHTTSLATAIAVTDAWRRLGLTVVGTVTWPALAASWLKPARQLVNTHPDAWVIIDNPAGCAQLAMRLAGQENWSPTRTFGTACLDSPDTIALTANGILAGMRGVTATGGLWRVGHGILLRYPLGTATP